MTGVDHTTGHFFVADTNKGEVTSDILVKIKLGSKNFKYADYFCWSGSTD